MCMRDYCRFACNKQMEMMGANAGDKYCSDPVWMKYSVSRFLESPVYSLPLLDFIDENCGMFEDSDDNKLEYTIVHENFKELVDGLISDFLTSLGIPVLTFVHMLANEVHASLYSIVVTSILTVDDFLLFKEMMLKRNFQISSQALSRMTNSSQELEGPVDLHSVIDHLSDMSKQQHSDKELAKSLSLADAYRQLANVKDVDYAAKCAPAFNLSLDEEKKWPFEDIVDHAHQRENPHGEGKKNTQCSQNLDRGLEELASVPTPPEKFIQEKCPTREPSRSPLTESTVTIETKRPKSPSSVQTSHPKRAPKAPPEKGSDATFTMENRKENSRTAKLSFETPQEVVFLEEPVTEILIDGEGDEYGDNFDEARCGDPAENQEPNEEPTTFKMLEELLDDLKMWKPKSLHLNVNDGEIQQRRRYLEQQRDRILAHKKSAREKQISFFRQLETKADASSQKLRRSTFPVAGMTQDTEANKKRETLRKELARCLKEELSNKTSNMSPDSEKISLCRGCTEVTSNLL